MASFNESGSIRQPEIVEDTDYAFAVWTRLEPVDRYFWIAHTGYWDHRRLNVSPLGECTVITVVRHDKP